MALSIFHPRNRFFNDEWSIVDPLFNDLMSTSAGRNNELQSLAPLMRSDLVEAEKEFRIHADLPGVEASDLDVSIEGKSLVIKAERKHIYTVETDKVHSMERSYGKVQRSIRLPNNVDMEKIESKFRNGVLSITIPKVAAPGPKKLEVQSE